MSKNTNELKTGSPGRFGIDVSTLGWPMEARILGHEHAGPALEPPRVFRRLQLLRGWRPVPKLGPFEIAHKSTA